MLLGSIIYSKSYPSYADTFANNIGLTLLILSNVLFVNYNKFNPINNELFVRSYFYSILFLLGQSRI